MCSTADTSLYCGVLIIHSFRLIHLYQTPILVYTDHYTKSYSSSIFSTKAYFPQDLFPFLKSFALLTHKFTVVKDRPLPWKSNDIIFVLAEQLSCYGKLVFIETRKSLLVNVKANEVQWKTISKLTFITNLASETQNKFIFGNPLWCRLNIRLLR